MEADEERQTYSLHDWSRSRGNEMVMPRNCQGEKIIERETLPVYVYN